MEEETFETWNRRLGDVVLFRRLELGLSRGELAKQSGLDRRNLKKIEDKHSVDLPKLSTLNKLSDALGMSLTNLVEEMTER